MDHVQDWQFCSKPAFNESNTSYKKQPFIDLGNGVGIYDFQDFKKKYPEITDRYAQKLFQHSDATQAYVLYIPENIKSQMVITLPVALSREGQNNKIVILVESSACVTVQHDVLTTSKNEITCFLQPYAQLTLIQNNKRVDQPYIHVSSFGQRNSTFTMVGWYTSSTYVYIENALQEKNAQSDVRIGYFGTDDQTCWVKTMQHHQAADTQSSSLIKGILKDDSHAVHLGMIEIDEDAQQVIASQRNKFLLMSDKAQAHAVPSLKVLANDVQCAHGSAIGSFDDDALFYMACRGIGEQDAFTLLERAFFSDVRVEPS